MAESSTAPPPVSVGLEVSIIIPAYGVAPWIGDALASVMAQTATSWEVIVVNDGSPDTPALEAALEPYKNRIIYQAQPNRGAAAARNTALALSSGEWIAFLDGDDSWMPGYLEHQLAVLNERALDMVWSNGFILGAEGEAECELMTRTPSRGPVTLGALLAGQVQVLTSATVVRRSLVSAVGGFNEGILRGQDFVLWAQLLKHGARAGYHQEPLIYFRQRAGNLSGGQLSQLERALGVLQHIECNLALSGAELATARQRIEELAGGRMVLLGKEHLAAGDYLMAAEAFGSAERRLPSRKLRAVLALMRISPALARWFYLKRRTD